MPTPPHFPDVHTRTLLGADKHGSCKAELPGAWEKAVGLFVFGLYVTELFHVLYMYICSFSKEKSKTPMPSSPKLPEVRMCSNQIHEI